MPSTGRLVPVVMELTTALVPVMAVCCSCREQFQTRDLGRIVGGTGKMKRDPAAT